MPFHPAVVQRIDFIAFAGQFAGGIFASFSGVTVDGYRTVRIERLNLSVEVFVLYIHIYSPFDMSFPIFFRSAGVDDLYGSVGNQLLKFRSAEGLVVGFLATGQNPQKKKKGKKACRFNI